jgi:uncharacterized repeat protein (TIGR03803 family)
MFCPDNAVLFGIFTPSSDPGGSPDDAVVCGGPLMYAISHRVGLAHGFLIHSKTGADHHMFVDDDVANVIRNIFKFFEANENILAATIVPGLRRVMNGPEWIAVHKITPSGTETVLYSFAGASDGANPEAGLIQGSDGNFYGTTLQGGAGGLGTVFKVAPSGTETVLHAFAGSSDGANP